MEKEMRCSECGVTNYENALNCSNCGNQLSTQTAEAKKRIIQSTQIFGDFKRTNVIFMVIFTIITGGVYIPIWFLRRRSVINNLKSSEKLGWVILFGMLILMVISLALAVLDINIGLVTGVLDLLFGGAYLIKIFKVRKILNEHYNTSLAEIHPRSEKIYPISNGYTFLFGIFYLQYKINRL